MHTTRREVLQAAIVLASGGLVATACSQPRPKETIPTSSEIIKIPFGNSELTLRRTNGSGIAVPVVNNYPGTTVIRPYVFNEIIKTAEQDQQGAFPNFSLSLENTPIGLDGYNSRTWDIADGEFANVKTTVGIGLRIIAGAIPMAMMLVKYQGRKSLEGSKNLTSMLAFIPDEIFRAYRIQALVDAYLTAVLTEELVEAGWSAKYTKTHTLSDYQRDFPTADHKEQITDAYSLPFKKAVFGAVLTGELTPAFTFPDSRLVTKTTIVDYLRLGGANEQQIDQMLKQWSNQFKSEGIE